jgi:hypothetical protein
MSGGIADLEPTAGESTIPNLTSGPNPPEFQIGVRPGILGKSQPDVVQLVRRRMTAQGKRPS